MFNHVMFKDVKFNYAMFTFEMFTLYFHSTCLWQRRLKKITQLLIPQYEVSFSDEIFDSHQFSPPAQNWEGLAQKKTSKLY